MEVGWADASLSHRQTKEGGEEKKKSEEDTNFFFATEVMRKRRTPMAILRKRLAPFSVPLQGLGTHLVPDAGLGEGDCLEEYGFDKKSKQNGFFAKKGKVKHPVVAVLAVRPATTLSDAAVVARLFGEMVRGRELVLWHVSVRRSHPLSDSDGGRRWGVYGVEPRQEGSKVRWYDERGTKVNKTNCESIVRGSPNPYAAKLIVDVATRLGVKAVRQHEAMPCSQLFDAQYSHRTHPAILLLFRSLGFRREGDAYAWSEERDLPLADNWERTRKCMSLGMPCVFPVPPPSAKAKKGEGVGRWCGK